MPEEHKDRGFRVRPAGKWYFWFWICAITLVSMIYLFHLFPKENIGPQQPVYFSHRVHAGVKKINCRFCHPFTARSEHAGLPEIAKCFFCHKYIIPTHPEIVKEREHLDSNTPVPWIRIYFIPDYVKFRHLPHLRWENIECEKCHGDVKSKDRLTRVDFKMGFCINCHKERNAQIDCWLACHH